MFDFLLVERVDISTQIKQVGNKRGENVAEVSHDNNSNSKWMNEWMNEIFMYYMQMRDSRNLVTLSCES